MARINIYKGARPSEGAINLRNALQAAGHQSLILRAEGSTYRGREGHTLINWGTSTVVSERLQGEATLLNKPEAVALATDKLETLKTLTASGVNVVPFFQDYDSAVQYVQNARGRIYARTNLRGHSGEGIHLILREDDPQNNPGALANVTFPVHNLQAPVPQALLGCRLFTVGTIGKRIEWRAHVFNGRVILLQKKLRRQGPEQDAATATTLVRNSQTGWVYSVNFDRNLQPEQYFADIYKVACDAIKALDLDFGAVDLIVDCVTNEPRVLEVNTAPGLEGGSTIEAYAMAFSDFAQGVVL